MCRVRFLISFWEDNSHGVVKSSRALLFPWRKVFDEQSLGVTNHLIFLLVHVWTDNLCEMGLSSKFHHPSSPSSSGRCNVFSLRFSPFLANLDTDFVVSKLLSGLFGKKGTASSASRMIQKLTSLQKCASWWLDLMLPGKQQSCTHPPSIAKSLIN